MAFEIERARLRAGIPPLQLLAMARIERAPGAWRQYGAFVDVDAEQQESNPFPGRDALDALLKR